MLRPRPALQAAPHLRRRLPLLPPLDRALARAHRGSGRVRPVPGSRRAFSGNPARGFRAVRSVYRNRRHCFQRSGGGLSLVRSEAQPPMDDLVLRARAGIRRHYRSGLSPWSPGIAGRPRSSRACFGARTFASQRTSKSATLVSPLARRRLPDRVRLALDAGGWIDRRTGDLAHRGIPAGRARPLRRQCSVRSAHALLAQLE